MSDPLVLIDDEDRPRGRKLHKATMNLFQRNDLLHEPSLRGAFLSSKRAPAADHWVSAFGYDEVEKWDDSHSNVNDDRVILWARIMSARWTMFQNGRCNC
jgi:hypothetical protein